MLMTRQLLRQFILEAVSAGPAYLKFEAIRQRLQDVIETKVKLGTVTNQFQLNNWFESASNDVTRLGGIQVERLRDNPQKVAGLARNKEIGDMIHDVAHDVEVPRDLTDWWSGVSMSLRALRGVPYDVWKKKLGL